MVKKKIVDEVDVPKIIKSAKPRPVIGTDEFGPWKWDGEKTIGGKLPEHEKGEWVTVDSLPEPNDPLGYVPETAAMVGGVYEILDIKWMIHPQVGRTFIFGVHYKEQNKVQYFWPWNLLKDKGR